MKPDWEQYVDDVLDGTIRTGKKIRLACERHRRDLEDGHKRGLFFDEDSAHRAVMFFEMFVHHAKGRWSGTPFLLLPWQKFLVASLYGWKDEKTGGRRFSKLYCQVARKNGKTALLSGIGLLMLDFDGEQGAEVYFSATKRDQAKIGHREATNMVKVSPELRKRVKVLRDNLSVESTFSRAEPLSSDHNSLDGLNVHCAVVDEFHAHKNADLFNVLDSATGSRLSPLVAIITTAGFNVDGPCHQMMKSSTEVLEGKKEDDSIFILIYDLDEDDDFHDPENWIKSNPSLGHTITEQYLKKQLTTALNNGGSFLTNFRTKHINEWVRSGKTWLSDDLIKKGDRVVRIDPLKPSWGGLDLSSSNDITAFTLTQPKDDGSGEHHFLTWYWLPEKAIENKLRTTSSHIYETLSDHPRVQITDGNVIDYDSIRRKITGYYVEDGVVKHDSSCLAERYNIQTIAFDRYNATQIVLNLDGDGMRMKGFGQGFVSMSNPTKQVEILVGSDKLVHGGDPLFCWMMGNVFIKKDPSGNIKPDKEKSGDKIDGVVSLIMSLGQITVDQSEKDEKIPDGYKIRTI